jgi:hypothetical protein
MTWQSVHGIEAAGRKAEELTETACTTADSLPNGARLRELTEKMLRRTG